MTRSDTGLLGTLLGQRYRVDRLLGRGGMSSVYRGVDTVLDREVAIKIMDARLAKDQRFTDRFEREARSAAQWHHPHVVAVHDQGLDDTGAGANRAFLVMELVDGGTLRDLMNEQGQMDLALALSVANSMLSALAAAHDAGLLHRDVKPENVLIGRGATTGGGGVVKVADFGLVRPIDTADSANSRVILGTAAYVAPEQVTTGAATPRGDVYSAGILLYEMLTGQTPYTGGTALSVAYQHVNDHVPRPSMLRPGIPTVLDQLVQRATRRDPEARQADAGIFLAELNLVRAALTIAKVAIPIPPPRDGGSVADVERTIPEISTTSAPSANPPGTPALSWAALPPAPPPSWMARLSINRNRLIAMIAAAALLLGVVIGGGVWLFADSGDGTVAVPQLVGQSQAAAGKALRDIKLTPKYPAKERHNSAPSGTVIRTDPVAGESLRPGAEVTVVISSGRPNVPDIKPGMTVEQAEQAIRDTQLQPGRGTEEYSSEVPQGAVLRVNPAPGTSLDLGSQVAVVVSKGPPPQPVPNVVGKSKDEAFKVLRQAGFEPVQAGEEFSADVAAGGVTRTDPSPGIIVTGESKKINLWVSNAVEVPNVRYMSFEQARETLSEVGLDPDGGGNGRGRGIFNLVLQQSPEAGTRVEQGSAVQLRGFR